jgi:membrane associated rhomboid family serine protease
LSNPATLVTSIFLHASLEHLLANILILFFFGIAVEKEMGSRKMLLIFFLGAFAGSLMSLAFYSWGTIGVGASSGIFALIGTGMLVKPLDLSFYPMIVPIPLLFMGLAYALYNLYAFIFVPDQTISYIGHMAGLIVGLIFGFRKTGMKKGMIIITIAIAIMILIPILISSVV